MTKPTTYMNVRLSAEAHTRLAELATDAGIVPGRLAKLLLEELLPTVSGVKQRLQVIRTSEAGR